MIDSLLIYHFQKTLNWSDKHILMSDLNFYYKSWENNQVNRKHKMMTNLLKHVKQSNLILITFTNMMTHNFHESKIIINLIFVSSIIHDQLIHYQIVTELNKISDYKLIKTLFYFNVKMREIIKHKAWKKTNIKEVKRICNLLWILRHLDFFIKIE